MSGPNLQYNIKYMHGILKINYLEKGSTDSFSNKVDISVSLLDCDQNVIEYIPSLVRNLLTINSRNSLTE